MINIYENDDLKEYLENNIKSPVEMEWRKEKEKRKESGLKKTFPNIDIACRIYLSKIILKTVEDWKQF